MKNHYDAQMNCLAVMMSQILTTVQRSEKHIINIMNNMQSENDVLVIDLPAKTMEDLQNIEEKCCCDKVFVLKLVRNLIFYNFFIFETIYNKAKYF